LDWKIPPPPAPVPDEEILAFTMSGADNGAHMLGSVDRLRDPAGVPVCSECGFKTDFEYVNAGLRIKQKRTALSFTYDGYPIANDALRRTIEELGYDVKWVELAGTKGSFVMQPRETVDIDPTILNRDTLCPDCGNYYSLCGSVLLPAEVNEPLPRGIYATDQRLGSGNAKHRKILVAFETWTELIDGFSSLRSDEPEPNRGGSPDLVFTPVPLVSTERRREMMTLKGVLRISSTPEVSLW
jgi:hypothetical protein